MSVALMFQKLRTGCARRDAWEMAESILKLEEKDKATFFSPSDVWCLPAPSSTKPKERQFVVDS